MNPHVIRLRGPWELEREGAVRRALLPCPARELGPGPALLRRRFGRPPVTEMISLRLENVPGLGSARLNGRALGLRPEDGGWVAEDLSLEPRNVLEIAADIPEGDGEWGAVALKIGE